MALPELVVDANIVLAALAKNSETRKILLDENISKLSAPQFIKEEILNHAEEFLDKLKIDKDELEKTITTIFHSANIGILHKEKYSENLKVAIELSPDKKDAPYFALALTLNCPIWSNDKKLKQQGKVKIYSTQEILELLK